MKKSENSRDLSTRVIIQARDMIYRGFVVTLQVLARENETLDHLDLRELRLAGLPARHEQRIKYHLECNLK